MADMGENVLEITGECNQLRRFRELADERILPLSKRDPYHGENSPSILSFHRLYPIPDAVAVLGYDPPGGGYDWQKENWGVKWGAADATREEYENGLLYVFDTAWAAPVPWMLKVSADYPLLTFELNFRDPISNWVDEMIFQDGKQVED